MELKKSTFDCFDSGCYLQTHYTHTYGEFSFVKDQIGVLSVHMGVISTHIHAHTQLP